MRINNKLLTAANFDPTKQTSQMSVFTMCDKIEEHSFSLPLYQRDISWTIQKSVDLLNYQLTGKAPVSPISINIINNTSEKVPQVSFIDRELIEGIGRGQYSVVDGQQRLTTNFKAYCNHEDLNNVVLDLGKGIFIQNNGSIKNYQIPVGVLLNKNDKCLSNYVQKHKTLFQTDVFTLLLQIRNKLKNYSYTINAAEDLTEDEQIEWFEVLNNAGSRVSIIQMRFSKLKAHGIDIYKQYTSVYKEKLFEIGYDSFFTPQKTNVSYPISALNPALESITSKQHLNNYAPMPSDSKESILCNLKPEQLKKCFSITLNALDKVLDFLNENSIRVTRIDYINYLIGYVIFNPNCIESNAIEIIRWINQTDFTNKSNSERRNIFTELINYK